MIFLESLCREECHKNERVEEQRRNEALFQTDFYSLLFIMKRRKEDLEEEAWIPSPGHAWLSLTVHRSLSLSFSLEVFYSLLFLSFLSLFPTLLFPRQQNSVSLLSLSSLAFNSFFLFFTSQLLSFLSPCLKRKAYPVCRWCKECEVSLGSLLSLFLFSSAHLILLSLSHSLRLPTRFFLFRFSLLSLRYLSPPFFSCRRSLALFFIFSSLLSLSLHLSCFLLNFLTLFLHPVMKWDREDL